MKSSFGMAILMWHLGCLLMLGSFINCGSVLPQTEREARILVIHSYHIEFDWTQTIDEGIMEVLRNKGYRIMKYFMDTKRHTDEPFIRQASQHALDLVKSFKPNVVIASDDNVQKYVGRFLVNRPDVSVVFCGVNDNPIRYGYPGHNVTGIRELPMLRSSLNLLKMVCPQVKSFTVFSSKGATSNGFIHYLKTLNLDIQVDDIVATDSFSQWKTAWLKIKSDAVITYEYHNLQENGQPVDPDIVLRWTVAHMNKPVIGFFAGDIQEGFLLGQVQSGFEQGELAAKKAIEILKGKKAGEIPITIARGGLVVINANTACRMGIDISPIENIADEIFYRQ